MGTQRKNISQPGDWWAAWQAAADKRGMTLSAWMAEQCNAALPKRQAGKLTERPPAHRPKKADPEG